MRKYLPILLYLFVLPAFGADITATTGWTCINSSEPTGSPTIDSGSNRKFVMHSMMENNTDPAPTVTVGGQSPTETVSAQITAQTNDGWHYRWTWDSTAIGNMSGTAFSYSDATGAFTKAFCYGTIEDTDQADIGALTTANNTSTTSIGVTSTSSTGDYIVCGGVASNGSSANSFTGWDTLAEIHDSDGGDGWRGGLGAGDGTDDTTTITYSVTIDLSGACSVYANAAGPTFTAGPTESTNTSTTVDFTFTSDTTGTVHWSLRNSGTSAYADCDAIQTGTGEILGGSEAVVADVADSDTVTFTYPEGDIDFCIDDGAGGQSAVSTLGDVQRNPCSGCAFAEIASSLSATSPFSPPTDSLGDTILDSTSVDGMGDTTRFTCPGELIDASAGFATDGPFVCESKDADSVVLDEASNATTANITILALINSDGTNLVNPIPAAGDFMEYKLAHLLGCDDDDADGNTETCVTFDTSWDLTVNFDTGETEDFVQVDVVLLQDVSDTTPAYASPLNSAFTISINNPQPVFVTEDFDLQALTKDAAMTAQDFDAECTHPNLTPETELHTDSSLPTGLSFSSGTLSGTPTIEDESGFTFKVLCSADGMWAVASITEFIVDTWTMPDITGDTVVAAEPTIVASAPWLENSVAITVTYGCSGTVAIGDIISQNPTASSENAAYAAISAVVSGQTCKRRRLR